jgi:hypothetical protein
MEPDMDTIDRNDPSESPPVSRRSVFGFALAAVLGTATALSATEAEARRWGNPPGWSRGRKRGWRKRGGPKWRW